MVEIDSADINNLLDQLEFSETPKKAARTNSSIERLVMKQAVYLPYAVDRLVLYRPAQLSNAYVQIALGNQYDVVNVGVQGIAP